MGFEEKKKALQKNAGHMSEESQTSRQEQLSPYLTSGMTFAQEGSGMMTIERRGQLRVLLGSSTASFKTGFR